MREYQALRGKSIHEAEDLIDGDGGKGTSFRSVRACIKDTFWSTFHEGDVGFVFKIMVNYCHSFNRGIEMMFLNMLIANSILTCLNVLQ